MSMEALDPPLSAENGALGHPELIHYRPRLRPQVLAIAPGIWTIFGLSLVNCHVIETVDGLICVDSGHSCDEGAELLRLIRGVSDKPIRGLLLTHCHYVRGMRGLLAEGAAGVEIVAHPRLAANVTRQRSTTAVACAQRMARENGSQLPTDGPDAVIAPAPPWYGENGFLPPTRTVLGGDTLCLAGETVHILDGCFDSDDGLAFRFPDRDAVAHNLVTAQFPNFGSLGGGRYRDPLPWLRAVADLSATPPQYLLPCHGLPVSGRDAVARRLRVNHQAIDFCYRAVITGLAAGASVADLIRDVHLPSELATDPDLRQLYGCVAHTVAAFAYGESGFWSGEVRDLVPLHPDAEARHLATQWGGRDALFAAATAAAAGDDLPWALHLADAALRCGVSAAASLRATLLRRAAQQTPAWTLRNTLLSHAREDEGLANSHSNGASRS